MKKQYFILILTMVAFCSLPIKAASDDDAPKRWGLQLGMGMTSVGDNSPEKQPFYVPNDNEGNLFSLNGDYFLTQRLALTGGVYFEQAGLLTGFSSGIGLKKINTMGLTAGAKYYFFPKKWIIQPHVGASLQTNYLNLSRSQGKGNYAVTEGYPGTTLYMEHDIQCPALSIIPQLGVDIHLFSTVSLCIDWDYRFGLGGHQRANMRFINGPFTGQPSLYEAEKFKTVFSIGVKMDFPTHKISQRAYNNALWLLRSWIESKEPNRRLKHD